MQKTVKILNSILKYWVQEMQRAQRAITPNQEHVKPLKKNKNNKTYSPSCKN